MSDLWQRYNLTHTQRNGLAEIRSLIFDRIHQSLPTPPYSESDKEAAAHSTFLLIFKKSQNGDFPKRRAA